jgi:hypothetical protein
MDRGPVMRETRTVRSRGTDTASATGPTTGGLFRWIGRFVIASILITVGSMVALTGAITIVGLPLGLILVGVGLELIRAASVRNTSTPG